MNDDPIKVLVVEPMQPCYVQEIHGLDDMQKIVGGDIEAVYPFQEPVAVVCNSEGKLQGLPFNRPLCGEDGIPYDILYGTFFLAGVGEEDFVSLTDRQVQTYQELYDNMMVLSAERPRRPEQKKNRGVGHER